MARAGEDILIGYGAMMKTRSSRNSKQKRRTLDTGKNRISQLLLGTIQYPARIEFSSRYQYAEEIKITIN